MPVFNCSKTIQSPVPHSIESKNLSEKFNIEKNINKVNSSCIVSSFVPSSHAVVNKSNSTLDVVIQSRCETFKVHSNYLNHTTLPERPPLGDIPYKLILLENLNDGHRKTLIESDYNYTTTKLNNNNLMVTLGTSIKVNILKTIKFKLTQNDTQEVHDTSHTTHQENKRIIKEITNKNKTCKDMYKPYP